jgi:hypothetical protein
LWVREAIEGRTEDKSQKILEGLGDVLLEVDTAALEVIPLGALAEADTVRDEVSARAVNQHQTTII